MDPVAAAKRLLACSPEQARALLLDDGATFPCELLPVAVLDVVMKRNLVFVSYQASKTGTWALSFDRDGYLLSWTEL